MKDLGNGTGKPAASSVKLTPKSIILTKPKNNENAKITVVPPTTVIHAAAVPGEDSNAKKSRIRIKYSGVNNGVKRSIGQNTKQTTAHNLPPPENESKENKQVPTNTSKFNKDLDEDFVKFADIDDIELPDGTKIGFPADLPEFGPKSESSIATNENNLSTASVNTLEARSKRKMKSKDICYKRAATLRVHEQINEDSKSSGEESSDIYACRHCGKRYRWKSTLRRHENDECGDKEPAHMCPYCPYKAKQRGNLGVHVRKHHADKPELESRRKRRSL